MKRAHEHTNTRLPADLSAEALAKAEAQRAKEGAHEKKIVFLALCLLCLLTLSSFAQSLSEKLEAHYASLTAWSADFEQTTYIDMLDQKTVMIGQIAVKRPDRIRVAYTATPAKVYVSDGKKLWVYKENEDTAWQFDKPKKVISEEALSFLSGLSNLSQIFNVNTDSIEDKGVLSIKNKTLQKIVLTPKEPDAIQKIVVGINERTLLISEAVLYNTSGNITHYLFKNVELNPALEDTFFTLPTEPKRKIIKK